jgi:hypothetical protein
MLDTACEDLCIARESMPDDTVGTKSERDGSAHATSLSLAQTSLQFFFFDSARRGTYSPRHPFAEDQ